MAPITHASDENNHQELLDTLDIYVIPKPFRNSGWRPPQRRNKTVKQIISEATRKEASVMATQNNSGISTPFDGTTAMEGVESTGRASSAAPEISHSDMPNVAQAASQSLKSYLAEKQLASANSLFNTGPVATYSNIEAAPSMHPASQRRYCDVTGLPAPYTDPKTRLRYFNQEIFGVIRTLPQASTESYLAARGAHTVLK